MVGVVLFLPIGAATVLLDRLLVVIGAIAVLPVALAVKGLSH